MFKKRGRNIRLKFSTVDGLERLKALNQKILERRGRRVCFIIKEETPLAKIICVLSLRRIQTLCVFKVVEVRC